jgi:hypothetical protein
MSLPSELLGIGTVATEVPLTANGDLVIADNAKILGKTTTWGTAVNTGNTTSPVPRTELGANAHVGNIWTRKTLTVRSNSVVEYDSYVGEKIDPQAGATVKGTKRGVQNSLLNVAWNVTFQSGNYAAQEAGPDATLTLTPGRHGDISVKGRGRLKLKTGTYYLDSLTSESGAFIDIDNTGGTVVIYVRGEFTHRGVFTYTKESSDVLVGVFNTDTIFVESEFDGTLIAPYAKLVLGGATNATFDGSFQAKSIEVRAGVQVKYKDVSRRGTAITGITPTVVRDGTSGPAPTPPSPVGKTYEEYTAAETAYLDSLVANQQYGTGVVLVAHPAASGTQNTSTGNVPAGTVASVAKPVNATSDATVAEASGKQSASEGYTEAVTIHPELVNPVPTPTPPPTAAAYATGFCPLVGGSSPSDGTTPFLGIDKSYGFGNVKNANLAGLIAGELVAPGIPDIAVLLAAGADTGEIFDAYYGGGVMLKAGLAVTGPFAQAGAGLATGVRVFGMAIPVVSMFGYAEGGFVPNDGRLLTVPYAKAGVNVLGIYKKEWRIPSDFDTTKEQCRKELKDCEAVYKSCCAKPWSGCSTDSACTEKLNACHQKEQDLVGNAKCIDPLALAVTPQKVNLYQQTTPLFPAIPIPIMTGVTGYVNAGAELTIPAYIDVDETGPDLTISPVERFYATVSVEVGALIVATIEGQIDILKLDNPVKTYLKWRLNESPEVCAAELDWKTTYQQKWSTLNGKVLVTLKIKISLPWGLGTIEEDLARKEIFSWDGLKLESPVVNLLDGQAPLPFKLDPNRCILGGNACATDATPIHEIGGLKDSGDAWWTAPAPYGEKVCPGQAVVKVKAKDSDVGVDTQSLLVSAKWDPSLANTNCSERRGRVAIWAQRNEGKAGVSDAPSPFYRWEQVDVLTMQGVDIGGVCVPQATHLKQLPDSLKAAYGNQPWGYIPLDIAMPDNRITEVRLVGHATENCSEVPLLFEVLTKKQIFN